MSQRTFLLVTSVIFALVAVGHLLRLTMGWPVVIGTWAAPGWISWIACLVAGALSYSGVRLRSSRP
jgi:hypothetical protein